MILADIAWYADALSSSLFVAVIFERFPKVMQKIVAQCLWGEPDYGLSSYGWGDTRQVLDSFAKETKELFN